MPVTVTCPCGAGFRIRPEGLGKKLRCRECDNVFIARAPASRSGRRREPVEFDGDDYDDPDIEDYDDAVGVEDDYEEPEVEDDYDDGHDEPAKRSGERFQSTSGRHKILMMACDVSIYAITPEKLQKACDELLKYLAASPDLFKQSEIRIAVRSTVKDANRAEVQIRMNGTVNDRQVRKSIEGHSWKVSNAQALGATQGIVGVLVGAAIDKATSKRRKPHPGLQQEFAKVRYEMLDACDKAIGRRKSKSTGRWKAMQIGACVAGVLAFLVSFALMKLNGDNVGMAVVAAAFVIVPAAFLVLAIGIVFMPDSFFLREAAGRRALRLSGASSPTAARIVGVITAVLMLALLVGMVLIRMKLK